MLTTLVFVFYDYTVKRRHDKLLATATRTNAIVASLFPKNVRDRIMEDAEKQAELDVDKRFNKIGYGAKYELKNFLDEVQEAHSDELEPFDTKPIADLFPEATVMFADISGT